MYGDFTATPLASVLSAVLDHAKVDFALRAGNASLPVMAVVFGPSSQPGQRSTKAAPPSPQDMRSETAAPSNSELVMTDRLAPLDLEVPAVELPELERNVEGTHRSVSVPFERRPVIQLPQIPVWRPLVTAPMQMSVQMVPKSGPVTAPPADPNAAARTPGPPSPVKRQ